MANTSISKTMNRLSVKTQTLATIVAIVAAVTLPQLFHTVGAVSGLGTSLGETFLPMHLPIILVGLLAGPYAGVISGAIAPLVSFAITGMPTGVMLPFIMIELAFYGLSAGLLSNVKIATFGKVIISQLAGRVVRAIALLFAVYVLGNEMLNISIIWNSIVTGLPGILFQWSLLPLLIFWIDNRKRNE